MKSAVLFSAFTVLALAMPPKAPHQVKYDDECPDDITIDPDDDQGQDGIPPEFSGQQSGSGSRDDVQHCNQPDPQKHQMARSAEAYPTSGDELSRGPCTSSDIEMSDAELPLSTSTSVYTGSHTGTAGEPSHADSIKDFRAGMKSGWGYESPQQHDVGYDVYWNEPDEFWNDEYQGEPHQDDLTKSQYQSGANEYGNWIDDEYLEHGAGDDCGGAKNYYIGSSGYDDSGVGSYAGKSRQYNHVAREAQISTRVGQPGNLPSTDKQHTVTPCTTLMTRVR